MLLPVPRHMASHPSRLGPHRLFSPTPARLPTRTQITAMAPAHSILPDRPTTGTHTGTGTSPVAMSLLSRRTRRADPVRTTTPSLRRKDRCKPREDTEIRTRTAGAAQAISHLHRHMEGISHPLLGKEGTRRDRPSKEDTARPFPISRTSLKLRRTPALARRTLSAVHRAPLEDPDHPGRTDRTRGRTDSPAPRPTHPVRQVPARKDRADHR